MSKVAAIITAGGIGSRTGLEIPKQFVVVEGKPVVIHTLEVFHHHPEIDMICVPCLVGWEERLKNDAKKFGISKLKLIVQGGETGFLSIRNALFALKPYLDNKDIVMVHDGIRPLVSPRLISDNLALCRAKGNAIAVVDCLETMLQVDCIDSDSAQKSLDKDMIKRAQAPQSLTFGEFMALHREAQQNNIADAVATSALLTALGRRVWIHRGDEKNIKITHRHDIEFFQKILSLRHTRAQF